MKIYVGSILQINHTSYISFPNCIRWTALLKAVQNFWDERNCNIHSMILTVKISLKKVVIMLGNGDECMTWMMPWMNYEQLFPTHIPPQWENCPRSPRSSWPKITSWCKEMHWKNSEDLSPICHKWPVSADIHTLLQVEAEKYELVWYMRPIINFWKKKYLVHTLIGSCSLFYLLKIFALTKKNLLDCNQHICRVLLIICKSLVFFLQWCWNISLKGM